MPLLFLRLGAFLRSATLLRPPPARNRLHTSLSKACHPVADSNVAGPSGFDPEAIRFDSSGCHPETFRAMRRAPGPLFVAKCGLLLALTTAFSARGQSVIQEFFVPMPEAQLQTSLNAIDTAGTKVGNTIKVVIALVTGATNTIIKYDQWKDGCENDLNNPTQPTTQIWGDGNLANGVAPGYHNDILPAGAVIVLTNIVTLPRNPAVTNYDGRDRIGATKPIVMTRAAWGIVPGTVLTSASPI